MERASEIRAGAVILVAVALTGGLWFVVWGPQVRGHAYPVTVVFPRVEGLARGGEVRLSGVRVGEVERLQPRGAEGVFVAARIDRGIALYEGYTYELAQGALIGEPYIEITPSEGSKQGPQLTPGATVRGTVRASAADLVTEGYALLQDLRTVTSGLSELVGEPGLRQTFVQVLKNVNDASGQLAALSRSLRGLAEDSAPRLQNTLASFEETSRQLQLAATEAHDLIAQVKGQVEGSTILADLDATAAKVRESAEHVERLTSEFARVTQNHDLSAETGQLLTELHGALEQVQATTKSFGELAEQAKGVVGDVGTQLKEVAPAIQKLGGVARNIAQVQIEPQIQMMGTPRAPNPTFTDFNFDFHFQKALARLGVAGIGTDAQLNLQYGMPAPQGWLRFGIVQGKVGTGLDWEFGNRLQFIGELYNPADLRANLYLQYLLHVDPGIGLLFGLRDVGGADLPIIGFRVQR